MHRFYADEQGVVNGVARLDSEDARHALRVLRLMAGAKITLLADGAAYAAELTDLTQDAAFARVLHPLASPESPLQVTLYQGVPKGDKMDYIVQKCTEAGVYRIVPVNMPRCVAKMEAGEDKKLVRWRRIAREAGKQAFRALTPVISPCVDASALPALLRAHQLALVPWEEARALSLSACLSPDTRDLALVIGPEGGMGEDEIARYLSAGAKSVTLGPRVFRTETAGLAAMIAAQALTGNLE